MPTSEIYTVASKLNYLGIPLGRLVNFLTKPTDHHVTQNTLRDTYTVSQFDSITLFAAHNHRLPIDMMAAAMLILRHAKITTINLPVAAYLYYQDNLQKHFFQPIENIAGINLFPVFRIEERTNSHKTSNSTISKIPQIEKQNANDAYLLAIKNSVGQPGTLNVVAPYGSRKKFLQINSIRKGVIDAANTGHPVIFSEAGWKLLPLSLQVAFSKVFWLENVEQNAMRNEIQQQFIKLNEQL